MVTVTSRRRARAETPVPVRRRRNVPLTLLGLLVVVGCALGFVVTSLHGRAGVLAVTRTLPAGHVLVEGDLSVERVGAPSSVRLVPVGERSLVVGRPLAVPVVAGTLLTPALVGAAVFPASD